MSLPATKQVLLLSNILIRKPVFKQKYSKQSVQSMLYDAESDECELTGQEDPVVLYMVIENSPLQHAFKEGITKKKTYRRNLIH